MMIDELKRLHVIALKLSQLGMKQTAGDIDYLIAWLRSPQFNNGIRLKPDPAGKNTVDAKSNNCPIPYTVSKSTVEACESPFTAGSLVNSAIDIITELKLEYTDNAAIVAFNEYVSNLTKVKDLLDEAEWKEWACIFPDFTDIDENLVWPLNHLY